MQLSILLHAAYNLFLALTSLKCRQLRVRQWTEISIITFDVNCRVDSDMTIKISDFGLSRDIHSDDYYRLTHKSKVPVKWMPPESLHDGMFTHQSDVV